METNYVLCYKQIPYVNYLFGSSSIKPIPIWLWKELYYHSLVEKVGDIYNSVDSDKVKLVQKVWDQLFSK